MNESRRTRVFLKGLRFISRLILKIIAKVELEGLENVPSSGGAIVVTNHIGRLDAMLGVVLADREDIIMMVAQKYEKNLFWRFMVKNLDALWLNRDEADFHTLRIVQKRLKAGGLLGMAPEGTRSKTESLTYGKPGAAYLADKSQVPIIPIGLTGTEDRLVKANFKRLRRIRIHAKIGKPIMLPPVGRQTRDEDLQKNTEEIMCHIAALIPPSYRGVYADYPRVQQLLATAVSAQKPPAVQERKELGIS
jgi:1-acyl-sn-glycerol-3-phosphate acyltransferase